MTYTPIAETVELRFRLPFEQQNIVHQGYTDVARAEEAFKAVDDPVFDCWIVEVFRHGEHFYAVMPRATFHILRSSEFTLFGGRWEVARYA